MSLMSCHPLRPVCVPSVPYRAPSPPQITAASVVPCRPLVVSLACSAHTPNMMSPEFPVSTSTPQICTPEFGARTMPAIAGFHLKPPPRRVTRFPPAEIVSCPASNFVNNSFSPPFATSAFHTPCPPASADASSSPRNCCTSSSASIASTHHSRAATSVIGSHVVAAAAASPSIAPSGSLNTVRSRSAQSKYASAVAHRLRSFESFALAGAQKRKMRWRSAGRSAVKRPQSGPERPRALTPPIARRALSAAVWLSTHVEIKPSLMPCSREVVAESRCASEASPSASTAANVALSASMPR